MPDSEVSPRRAMTRHRLVESAITVCARRGIAAATVEEICETAGFTRGAFYSNFESKEELLVAVLRSIAEQNLAAARDAVSSVTTTDDAIKLFIAASPTDPDTIMVMAEMQLFAAREPAVREDVTRLREEITAWFVELIEQAVAARGLRLTMPAADVTTLLADVYEQTAVRQLIVGRLQPDAVAARLQQVLTALVVGA